MDGRDAWVDIDEGALRHNLRALRAALGTSVRIYLCVKMNAYGFGSDWVAPIAAQEGMDGFACCDALDAARVRAASVDLPILLYPGKIAASLLELAQPGMILTAHDASSLDQCVQRQLPFYLKIDSGFGRLGFAAERPQDILERITDLGRCRLIGAYAHFSDQLSPAAVARQGQSFQRCVDAIEAGMGRTLERNVGASRVLITDPAWALNAVNPGGLVYGLYDALGAHRLRPVLTAVKARVIALRHMAAGTTSGYAGKIYERDSVIAIVPIGYADGLPRVQERGQALLRGHRIPLSGPRHAEYTMMDVTDMAEVQIGDEVVFVGSQGGDDITLSELTTGTDLTETDLLQRLARHPHRHLI